MTNYISQEEYDTAIRTIKNDATSKERIKWNKLNRRETACVIDGIRIGKIDEYMQGKGWNVYVCGKLVLTRDGEYAMKYRDEDKAKKSLLRNFFKK